MGIRRIIFRSVSPAARRSLRCVVRDRSGAAAVEFAIVAPLLLMILTGIVQFGITLNNYIELTNAVRVGARQFAIGRSSTTPMTNVHNAVTASAMNLSSANIAITYKVNNTACASDSACRTALNAAAGGAATVRATYPCDLTILGIDYVPSCVLSAQNTEFIE